MSASKDKQLTPMLRQYMSIKEQYQDAILFYRLGDFYEMFFEDAVTASRILGITLTSRDNKNEENRVPLCGVPYHSVSTYLAKLIKAGYRVAICEQVEDPAQAKGVVKREVVRVVSPGVVTEEQILDDKTNQFLASIFCGAKWGASFLDISTGEFLISEHESREDLIDELQRMTPAELLISEDENHDSITGQLEIPCLTSRPSFWFSRENARETMLEHFQVTNLKGFGCENLEAGISAAGALLNYLRETQKAGLDHIERLTPISKEDALIIDDSSRRNLELTQTIVGGGREGSLLHTLDHTVTPMGARLLKRNLLFPSRSPEEINHRLDTVEFFYSDQRAKQPSLTEPRNQEIGEIPGEGRDKSIRAELRKLLAEIYDLERLNSRVVLGSAGGRDLLALKKSLAPLPRLARLCSISTGLLAEGSRELDTLEDIHTLLEETIREDAPMGIKEGGLIKPGYKEELDELVSIVNDTKKHILAMEAREKERTGIPKLKIGFNKVFGYYLEVSKAQVANVPEDFIRKQTLVNAERYITPELKEFEQKVLSAEEKSLALEYRIFSEIRSRVAASSSRILRAASFIARADYYTSLAETALNYNYVRPRVDGEQKISIKEGRHPVIEKALPPGKFVPNDVHLDQDSQEVLIITGPNMAGKSTVLRQSALITLMAQMGSFVPATKARVGVVDKIFTRVGAMDDLRRGQSTFMVEMNETANILNNATDQSLVILDEIGRGTSTFDGLAIAWAVSEELVNKNDIGVKTIFATHYHELTELAAIYDRIKNYHIGVKEWNNSIIFLHKLLAGGTDRSYGIEVAALAGVPKHVVRRAEELLTHIQQEEYSSQELPRIARSSGKNRKKQSEQGRLFQEPRDPLREEVANLEPDNMTPRDALDILYKLKDRL
ncbi:MAG: DNA mismatch repair protein MutS [Desulfurivibrionaceae bacterium]